MKTLIRLYIALVMLLSLAGVGILIIPIGIYWIFTGKDLLTYYSEKIMAYTEGLLGKN